MQQWEERHVVGSLADVHAAAETWAAEDALRQAEAPTGRPVRMPCPEGLDPAKWAQLDRRTRRQLQRFHVKQQRRAAR